MPNQLRPSKRAASAISRMVDVAYKHVVVPAMRAQEGLSRLTALVENWFGRSTKAGLVGGCPAAAGMFELDDVEGPVRDKLLELEEQWDKILKQFIVESIAAGDLTMRAVASCVVAMQTCGQRRPFKDWLRGRPLWVQTSCQGTIGLFAGSRDLWNKRTEFRRFRLEPHIEGSAAMR